MGIAYWEPPYTRLYNGDGTEKADADVDGDVDDDDDDGDVDADGIDGAHPYHFCMYHP